MPPRDLRFLDGEEPISPTFEEAVDRAAVLASLMADLTPDERTELLDIVAANFCSCCGVAYDETGGCEECC